MRLRVAMLIASEFMSVSLLTPSTGGSAHRRGIGQAISTSVPGQCQAVGSTAPSYHRAICLDSELFPLTIDSFKD